VVCGARGNAVRLNNSAKIVFIVETSFKGIKEIRLCKKMMAIPIDATVFNGTVRNKLRMIKPKPIVAITSKLNV